MDTSPPGGTKYDILKLLMKAELSALQLAERLSISSAAVRQHMQALEGLGLVQRRRVVSQPSRPTHLYRLSEAGKRVFPQRHDLLLMMVLEELRQSEGPERVDALMRAAARRMAAEVRPRFGALPPAQRWAATLEWLEGELAWEADAEALSDGQRIVIHQCPFAAVSRTHPEVCGTFFSELIHQVYESVPVTHAPDGEGPACCSLRTGPP